MKILTLFLALAIPASSERLLTVACDPVPTADGYRFWREGEFAPILLAAVDVPRAEIEVPAGAQAITATAWNGAGESGHSQPMSLPPEEHDAPPDPPIPPPMAPYQITVTLQSGDDLNGWKDRAVHFFQSANPKQFYRLKIEVISNTPPAP